VMDCKQAKSMFSTYLDGAVSGHEMRAISLHMEKCGDCHTSYLSLQRTQALLSSLGTRKAPSDLPLRLKVAIQQERSRSMARTWQNIGLRIEHALNSFMLPATAGLVTAVIMFGVLIGFFALPEVANDIPTSLYTPPRLAAGPYEIQGIEGPVLIEANVDSTGRVLDYRILSGHDSDTVRVKIDNALIFTTFEPARAFGAPASGHVVLAFSTVNVRG
jgi:anti-sigma factor RsiW